MFPVRNQPQQVVGYFTPLQPSYTKIIGDNVYYRANGDYLNKIGIQPENTVPLMAAWDAHRQLLTIVTFSFKPEQGVFVNSVWSDDVDPYRGDVINLFNDGVLDDVGPFGPFYEFESSSHALELKPGQSQEHSHTTVHLEGNRKQLNQLSRKLLGVGLAEIEAVFSKE